MAARLLHSLADENPDLQKQIGCMKGILQLFDCQHIRIVDHSHKGNLHFSNDIRDVVKVSMNREAPGLLSTKSKLREEVAESNLKHIDYLGPMQIPEAFDEEYERALDVKQNSPEDLKESLRVLAKLQETQWYPSEPREPSRPNFASKPSRQDSGSANFRSTRQPISGAPSVVAKLMGLETLPDSTSTNETNIGSNRTCQNEDPVQISNSTRNVSKEPTSTRWSPELVMKPISRFPIEPAPWRKFDRTQVSEKPAARSSKSLSRTPLSSFPCAYSEIEKRFMDLEFTKPGKDLRALKQILEAMQKKGILATQKDCHRENEQSYTSGSNSLRHFESSIVIMKPAKLLGKSGTQSSPVIPLDYLSNEGFCGRNGVATRVTVKDRNLKTSKRVDTISSTKTNSGTSKSPQISVRSKENTSSSLKTSGLQQKKLELEKQSRPSNLKISRRQAMKQQVKSSSPGGKHGQKSSNILQNDDLKEDSEVTSTLQSSEESSNLSPLAKTLEPLVSGYIQKKSTFVQLENELLAKPTMLAPEYPSPVSVLDNVEYTDESPSPVKHISEAREEDRSEYRECNPDDNVTSSTFGYAIKMETNRKKLQKIENLVQKLRRLNSSHDESHTDYIASICESTNPDHRYVAEILLASGLLLEDLNSSITAYQFHSSGYPINPELFYVIEQTKESTLVKEEGTNKRSTKEKLHRKLIFDFVNELLAAKLGLVGPVSEPWLRPRMVATKATPNSQQLLRELCAEIEPLHAKPSLDRDEDDDTQYSLESWSDFTAETSNVVLALERLVFKDLVDEIVRGDGNSLMRTKPTRQKQLFKK